MTWFHSHHSPRGPRRLLCVGRTAARPSPARQADCGRRRRRSRGLLRSAGLRRTKRHAWTARAATLSRPRVCRRTFRRIPTARRRRHRSPERFHAFHRAHLHRRGLRRRCRVHASLRFAGRDRKDGSGSRARRAWLADVNRRGAYQAPGEDRIAGREAGWIGRRRSRN